MRTNIKLTIATVALLLASASLAMAQTAAVSAPVTSGSIDLGGRFGSTSGDEARFERFRDLRNGAFSRITFGKNTDTVVFDLLAENIGYRDQRYAVGYDNSGKVQFGISWDSTPLNYSYQSATPWVETSKGVWTLDVAARQSIQNNVPGVLGIPTTAAQLLQTSIWEGLARPFDIQSRRDTAEFRGRVAATRDLNLNFSFRSAMRDGYRPFTAAWAFRNANEIPLPNDDRTNDVSAGLEWVKPEGMLRLGWEGSWYTNNITELVVDNPYNATDTNPYDPSGYSNGRGPAQGRMSVPPNNSTNTVGLTGLYKMPSRTTLNGTLSFSTFDQNDALIPWTINQVINSPAVLASFPHLQDLPRSTAEAKVQAINALLNFTSRPTRFVGLSMRYRYNNHDNQTPHFPAEEYVRFDAVPEETGGESEQFDIRQNTLDITATLNLFSRNALRLSYGYDDFTRSGRSFSDMTDYTGRVSLDLLGTQRVTVRAAYEHTKRIGTGFSESALEEGGAQPNLRFYDEADRDRNRGTLLFLVDPIDPVTLSFSVAAGKDRYHGPGHEFGLLNNSNTSYNVGFAVNPSDQVSFGANYGRDTFSSLQKSRSSNPPPSPYWDDPLRDWTLDNNEKANNINVYLDLPKAIAKTDLSFGYDFSDSDGTWDLAGPMVVQLTASGTFLPLPNVTNSWHRVTADLKHYFTDKVGVGIGYWFEKFDVADFATIDKPGQPGTPRYVYLGGILTGYGVRPYKGSTGFVRVLYNF